MAELKDKKQQYDVFLKYKEKTDDNGFILSLKIIIIALIIIASISFCMFLIDNHNDISSLFDVFTVKKNPDAKAKYKTEGIPSKFNLKMLSRYQNILLLGVDSNGPDTLPFSGVRSDTMIILNIDVSNKGINAISIPRDSKVYIADEHGVQKINAAYALGGIELTKKTIEETLGIKIHNYIIVNSEGIKKLIDTIGGIPIHIDQNMHYIDYSAHLNINLAKGDYILNGEQAEGYLRFRKDMLGDIGRVHRQQKFVKALIEQVKSPETAKKIPELLKIASLYTRTDMNLYQLSQYASLAREINLNNVEFVTLPGGPNKKGIISYWILDPEKTQQTINRLIYHKKINLPEKEISVGIMFPRIKEIDAFELRDQFKNLGFEVNCMGRSEQISNSEIIGYNSQITPEIIKDIKKKIPDISDLKFSHSPVRSYCTTSDIVVTIKDSNKYED